MLGGGEEENYEIINEKELRPIINVYPSEEDIFQKLEYIVLNKERIPELSAQSIEYVRKHHNYVKVAQQYVDFGKHIKKLYSPFSYTNRFSAAITASPLHPSSAETSAD